MDEKDFSELVSAVDERAQELRSLLRYAPFQVFDEKYFKLDDYIVKNLMGPLSYVMQYPPGNDNEKSRNQLKELQDRIKKGNSDFSRELKDDVEEAALYKTRYKGDIYAAWRAAAKVYDADPETIIF